MRSSGITREGGGRSLGLVFLALLLTAFLTSCGGGGGDGNDERGGGTTTGVGWVTITSPQPSSFSTEASSVELGGAAFVSPDKSVCCSAPITGVTVTWSSSAGASGGASQNAFLCGPFGILGSADHVCNHTWRATVPLVLGANTIQVRATDFGRNSATATITITRVPETVPPSVTAIYPANFAVNAPVNSAITVTFSEAMDNGTLTPASFLLRDNSGNAVPGTVSITDKTATFQPASFLAAFSAYTASVTTSATDLAGNPLKRDVVWSFTTGNADITPPSVLSFFPAAGTSCMAVDDEVNVQFSEPVKGNTVGFASFTLTDDTTGNAVTGGPVLSSDGMSATFQATKPVLSVSHTYTGTLTNGITDLAGNSLFRTSWSFVTQPDGDGVWSYLGAAGSPPQGVFSDASLVWTGNELIVFGGYGILTPNIFLAGGTNVGPLDRGARYSRSTQSWTALPPGPSARYGHIAVWTGTEMLVWGGVGASGLLTDGARYNAATNTWIALSSVGAPLPSNGATGVWTGQELIIWGSAGSAAYNPATDAWRPLSNAGAPTSRMGHTALWTGSRMIIWGGVSTACTSTCVRLDGAIYDPIADNWQPVSSLGEPDIQTGHTAVWTGTEMAVWGGKSGGLYDPVANRWRPIPSTCGPASRSRHVAVWTGSEMIVWGGNRRGTALRTGARYDPVKGTWQHITLTNGPDGVNAPKAVWTGNQMIVFPAGLNASGDSYAASYAP